jgi:acyl carrier protein
MYSADEFIASFLNFLNCDLPGLRGKRSHPILADTHLFESGILDSLSILHVMAFIERYTGTPVADELILPAIFQTPRTITAMFATRSPTKIISQ